MVFPNDFYTTSSEKGLAVSWASPQSLSVLRYQSNVGQLKERERERKKKEEEKKKKKMAVNLMDDRHLEFFRKENDIHKSGGKRRLPSIFSPFTRVLSSNYPPPYFLRDSKVQIYYCSEFFFNFYYDFFYLVSFLAFKLEKIGPMKYKIKNLLHNI